MSPAARTRQLRPTAVNQFLQRVRAREAAGKPVISLLRGEPDFPTPEHIVRAAQDALRHGLTQYPPNQGVPELRRAIAGKLGRFNSVSCDPDDEVLVTDGATLGLYVALLAICDPADGVLLPDFVYDCYQSQICGAGAVPIPVRVTREGSRFVLTGLECRNACDSARSRGIRARALLINTPWNPTGTVMTNEELDTLATFVLERDLYLLSDEIYEAITFVRPHVSPASLNSDIRQRTISLFSMSKTYAMTGWRLGYSVAPPSITHAMLLALQQMSRGPARFVQHAGIAALEGPQDCVADMLREYALRRELLAHLNLPGAEICSPEGGFFSLLNVAQMGSSSEAIAGALLDELGVAVMSGSAYGPGGEGFLRLSFATGAEVIERASRIMTEGWPRIASKHDH